MAGLPVMLDVRGWRCVIVGGGGVAVRRARSLLDAGATVVVIAPRIAEQLDRRAQWQERPFQAEDVAGARLVIVATDDPAVNAAVEAAARAQGALLNRADEAGRSELAFLAHRRVGPITVAVHSGGGSAAAARQVADDIAAGLDPRWALLLEAAAIYRPLIQDRFPPGEARQARLRKLTDSTAMQTLREQGPAALDAYCQRLADPQADAP